MKKWSEKTREEKIGYIIWIVGIVTAVQMVLH